MVDWQAIATKYMNLCTDLQRKIADANEEMHKMLFYNEISMDIYDKINDKLYFNNIEDHRTTHIKKDELDDLITAKIRLENIIKRVKNGSLQVL